MLCLCDVLQSGGQDQERRGKKRKRELYSVQTSLIVAAHKKLLPIGLNMCTAGDQELISLAKIRYSLVSMTFIVLSAHIILIYTE